MLHTQLEAEGKKNLKVEKKEKEEQRHGSVPGAPGCLADHTLSEQGPYSRSPPQSGPDPPEALSTAELAMGRHA